MLYIRLVTDSDRRQLRSAAARTCMPRSTTTTSSCSINDNHCRQNSSPGVYLLSSGLLQQCNSMLYGMSGGLLRKVQFIQNAATRHSGHRSSTMRPHHAGAASAALAACPSTSRVQGYMPGTPVAGWSDTRVHSRRHPTRYGSDRRQLRSE